MVSFKSTEMKEKLKSWDIYIERHIEKEALAVEDDGIYLSRGLFPKEGTASGLINWGLYFAWSDLYRICNTENELIDELTAFNLHILKERILPDASTVGTKPTLALSLLLRILTEIGFWEPRLINEPGYLHSEYLTILDEISEVGDFSWIRDILPLHLVRYAINTTGFKDAVKLVRNIEEEKNKVKEEISFSLGKATSALEQDKKTYLDKFSSFTKERISEAKLENDRLTSTLNEINKSKNGIDEIRKSLLKYHSEYNFVGLYDGFKRLKEDKDKELDSINEYYHIAMIVAIILPLFTIGAHLLYPDFVKGKGWIEWLSWGSPFAAIELLILYYARVMYSEVKSIKAQLVQINLRGSLCQFIEAYMDYRSKVKDKDGKVSDTALDKFDSVIFSAIQMDGDNIPSAFDGVSAIAELAGKIIAKGKL